MAGDPLNARLWTEGDVYVSFNLSEANPATVATAFGGGWDLVGLLDGETGFTENREQQVTDFYAWGQILVRTARRNYKETHAFVAYEDTDLTERLYRPGSTAGEYSVPVPEPAKVAFETREGTSVKRLITRNYAEVTLNGQRTVSESGLTTYPLIATIYPDGDGVLFDIQETAASS